MANPLLKFITKTATAAASSLVTGELKKHAKAYIEKYTAKSPEVARQETAAKIGYETEHFVIDKNRNVVFKSSAMFMHEWLNNAPGIAGKVLKDEENGQIFYDGAPMTNGVKMDLMAKFAKATGINTPALNGHFEKALDLLDVKDFTSARFAQEFGGWDPVGRVSVIDTWIGNCFANIIKESGLITDEKLAKMMFRKWIIGTARRALNPGETLDGCLVLQGPTGAGKTQFFRKLLPPPFDNRTGEIYCDVKSPQRFVEAIVGKTVACFDELSVLDNPKSDETFKQLLSSQFIDVRLAWARKPRRYAIRQGFSATTNKKKFINDPFLSRRLWVIELNGNRINYSYLNDNRRALWMEAVYYAERGESCILTPEEQRIVEDHNKKFEA